MRILLAIDASAPSQAAVHVVQGMALPPGSTVRILTVVQEPIVTGEFGAVDYGRVIEELRGQAAAIVRDALAALAGREQVETAVRTGESRLEIVAEAKSWHPDLIVMGSHGRTGLKRLMMGSVAEYVMRHAPCSVEIAREPVPAGLHP